MSRLQSPSALKRKRPDSNSQGMTDQESVVYKLIHEKENMGIWVRDIKRSSNLQDTIVNKSIKTLLDKGMIKEVINVQNKTRKTYLAAEFEPSPELTGGAWYDDGNLDVDFINAVKKLCSQKIKQLKVATVESVMDSVKASGAFKADLKKNHFEEIFGALVLDNEVMEVESNGMGEFAGIKVGKVCYKAIGKRRVGAAAAAAAAAEPRIGAMASIPCGVCPRISSCTPDGVISPGTCVYYQKWLDF
ncbi:unnamed protein product [Linum tenue]|uniref:DNA-directed RNA polymerase III subunit RPC6 n=1 Tax=Linum tenue TaxID=586396 RepID=A0AAV0IHW2_9ROSI|nr:unnamed protein product [Linum tenue]